MQQQIEKDIVSALKQGDKKTAEALRFLKSAIINARIKLGHDLTDVEVTALIRKEIKLRDEAAVVYAANQRQELAEKEKFEKSLFVKYVPEELSQDQILQIVEQIAKTLEEPATFAKLMPATVKEIAGRADGQTIAVAVKDYLNGGIK